MTELGLVEKRLGDRCDSIIALPLAGEVGPELLLELDQDRVLLGGGAAVRFESGEYLYFTWANTNDHHLAVTATLDGWSEDSLARLPLRGRGEWHRFEGASLMTIRTIGAESLFGVELDFLREGVSSHLMIGTGAGEASSSHSDDILLSNGFAKPIDWICEPEVLRTLAVSS